MKKPYIYVWLFLLFIAMGVHAQTTTSVTHTAGILPTDHFTGTVLTTTISACPASLTVPVPAGRYVTSVDVEYSMQALGSDWLSEQSSYLECVTTSTVESSVSLGPSINNAGTHAYSRSGLTFANGIVPAGGLQFNLHAFRSFTGGGCTSSAQRIVNNTYKITVHHVAAPTCLPPTSAVVNSISTNSVNIGWTTGGATNWQIEYGPLGFSPGTGTLVNATTNPFTLTGLNPSTHYEFIVRDSCAVGDVSFWSTPTAFRTLCSVINAPWNEDFEAADWVAGGFNNAGNIDTCYERDYPDNFIFKAGPPVFTISNTGPSGDHTSGSGKYVYSERIAFTIFPDTTYLISPPVSLTTLTTPELTFWYHMFGLDVFRLRVLISNDGGNTFSQIFVKTGQQQLSKVDPWKEAVINLSSYANDTVLIKFEVIQSNSGSAGDVAIDDVSIHEQPTCPKPTDLQVVSASFNSITLGWTSGGASNWQIEYGASGFIQGNGTIVAATSNPFTITGLSPNTTYDFYVRDSCSATDVSAWSIETEGQTYCTPVSAPYFAAFDGPAWDRGIGTAPGTINSCWRREVDFYIFKSGPPTFVSIQTGAANDHTSGSGKYLQTERTFFTSVVDTAFITSVLIDLSPLTTPEMSFWYHMFGVDIDWLRVEVSNDGGANYTQVQKITGQQQISNNDAWKESIINLSAYAGDTVLIRFTAAHINLGFNADICIDDLSIHEQPSCPKPSLFTVNGKGSNSVTLQWTSGGSSNWNIEYGSPGFIAGTGTRINVNTNPYTVTGLSPNTAYEFYVRDSCGATDLSAWVGPIAVTTDCAPVSAPFTENFDGSLFVPGSIVDAGDMDPCWWRDTNLNYLFMPATAMTTNQTGPSADHTSGSGKFIFSNRFFGSANQSQSAVMISKAIDLSTLTIPELTFWYHMFGVDIDSLTVEISDGSTWNKEISLIGSIQTAQADPWLEYTLNMSAYANDTVKLRFTAYRNSAFAFRSAVALDDISIHEQPTCPKPSAFTSTSSASNSITFSWTSGGASNWQMEYGLAGFTPGSGTIVNVATNPFTVTGLNSSTTYEFYLRDSCSSTDQSFWVGPLTVTTQCLPLLAPFTENFDGSSWVIGTNFNDTGEIGVCWNRTPLVDYVWKPGPPIFTSTFTGPSVDHTTGNGQFLFSESIFAGGTAPFTAFIESPIIDLTALTVPELSFWYYLFGNGIDSMRVEVDNGSGYTKVWSKIGQHQFSNSDPWKEAVVNLSSYANDTIRIRFSAHKSSATTIADIALDDVDIHESPSCPKPQDILIAGKSSNSVTLSWTSGGASNWNIEYGSPGFTPGSGTIVNASSNPFTITGLTASTAYDFYVRDSCGVGDVSVWVGPIADTTDCAPINAPYAENFDGSSFVLASGSFNPGALDPCWNREMGVNYIWAPQTSVLTLSTGPSVDHTSGSGKFLHSQRFFGSTVTNTMSTEMESPNINLGPLTIPEMSFWYHMFGADIDSLKVEVFNGNTWSSVFVLSGQQQSSKTAPWQEAVIDLSAFANDTVKVRFEAYRNTLFAFNSVIAIDDFSIHEQPSCPQPSNLTVTGTSASTITLGWTSGGASNWQIEYGASGFSPGSGTIIGASTNPFTVTGLSGSTSYDFYLRDSCGIADVSAWIGPISVSTDCLPLLAPFTENFDAPIWQSGPNFNDTGSIAMCWQRTPLADYVWRVGPTPFISTVTGPSADHTTGSGNYIFAESIFGGGTPPFDALLESPLIDLSALTVPELRFWYHMFGNAIGVMSVDIDNGSGYTQVWSLSGQQQFATTDPWKEAIVSLSAYANDTIRIRISATKSSFSTVADAALDDISIQEAPSCPQPGSLTAGAATNSSIQLSWTTGGASNWLIGYRPSGTSIPLTILPASTNPFTISGLSPSSSYDFYLRDSCGTGDVSVWIGPITGTTLCGVATAPWAENFDGGAWTTGTGTTNLGNLISNCWSRPSASNPNFGTRLGSTNSANTGPNGDASGSGNYIYTEASGAAGSGEITTPWIYIPNSISNPRLKFAYHMFGTNITSLAIKVNSGSGFGANVFTLTGGQQTSNSDAWRMDSVSLNAHKGDTIQVKFIGTNTGFMGDISIDEVSIIGDPGTTCSSPSALIVNNITASGFTINWLGNGTSQVEVVSSGMPQGSGTLYNNVSSPFVVTGLNSNASYDIYVRDSCGASLYSGWVNTNATTTSCPAINPIFSYTSNWLALNFNSMATANADSIYWDFGDGSQASLLNPTHAYGAAGKYIVTMNAFSICGNSAVLIDTINVCDTLSASFVDNAVADSIQFDASGSKNASTFKWVIDGKDTVGEKVTVKFTSIGTKTVTLKAYNECGDSSTVTKTINACPPPWASWVYNIISTTGAGMKVQFDGTASLNASGYVWDFGDGSPTVSGIATPQHTYVTPGLFYKVKLTVTNSCGNSNSLAYTLREIGLEDYFIDGGLVIFPNPADEFVMVKWNARDFSARQLTLIDGSGKVVRKLNLEENLEELELDISNLSKGFYTLMLSSDRTHIHRKLIID